jgi:hypothetical protein
MARIGARGPGWKPPAGIEQRTVDAMGAIVSDGCMPQGPTHTEYFLSGTAPVSNCYPSGYALDDTTAWYDSAYDAWRDSISADDDAWWERLRSRTLSSDTLPTVPVDTVNLPPPGGIPPTPVQPPPGTPPPIMPPNTIPPGPDTLRLPPGRRPLRDPVGRPVRPPPRRDTIST